MPRTLSLRCEKLLDLLIDPGLNVFVIDSGSYGSGGPAIRALMPRSDGNNGPALVPGSGQRAEERRTRGIARAAFAHSAKSPSVVEDLLGWN